MQLYLAQEIDIPHETLLALRKAGKLRLGINNEIALKVTNSGLMPKGSNVQKAMGLWSWVAMGLFVGSVYLSFASAWWWFIPGFAVMMLIHSANKSANSENLLDLAMSDPVFYEKLRHLGVWQYQIAEADAAPYLTV